jgi:hypothetical protein
MQSMQEVGFLASTLSGLTSDSAIVKLSIIYSSVKKVKLENKCPRLSNFHHLISISEKGEEGFPIQKQYFYMQI